MSGNDKFGAIRKGLLEFLILKIVSADEVYVADMLERLSTTEFATQEGTLYPLLIRLSDQGPPPAGNTPPGAPATVPKVKSISLM